MMQAAEFKPSESAPAPMATAVERRASPRVSLDLPVRLGPPEGQPESAVSVRDVSEGGLFIDADRPVRVGARFSVEIPHEARSVYVAQAEVAYNRRQPTGSGFGVRFLDLDRQTRRDLRSLVQDRIAQQQPGGALPEEAPQFSRLPRADLGLDMQLSSFSEPVLGSEELDLEAFVAIPKKTQDPKRDWARQLRALPWAQIAGFVLGAVLLVVIVALAGAIYNELSTEPEIELVRADAPEGVDPLTHDALMGARSRPVSPRSKDAPVKALPNDLLPELESVDEAIERADATRRRPRLVAAPPAPEAQAELAPQPKKPAKRAVQAKPVEKKAPAKPKKPAVKAASKPKATPSAKPAKAAPSAAGRIKKSFVLKAPVRFAVDVVGVSEAELQLPAVGGWIQRVRTGRHDDFVRVVFDLKGPVKTAKARMSGRRLLVNIDPA